MSDMISSFTTLPYGLSCCITVQLSCGNIAWLLKTGAQPLDLSHVTWEKRCRSKFRLHERIC
jgi:hypothetical protein